MKRALSRITAVAALLAAMPGCAYEVPDLIGGQGAGGGIAGPGTGVGTGTGSSASTGIHAVCDTDGLPCTDCPNTCHPQYGCSQCNDDGDCGLPNAPFCVEGRCLACGGTTGCPSGEACHLLLESILPLLECGPPCVTAADCPNSNNAICSADGRCVRCVPGGCGGGKACDPSTGQCEECVQDSDCTEAARPHCGWMRRCVACAIDIHCPANEVCRNNSCDVACCSDDDCTTDARPVCDTATARCVQCLTERQCAAPTPRCFQNNCSACTPATESTDCAAPTPLCDGGDCVQCISDAECVAPLGHCSSAGSCVQCENSTHCDPGLSCVDNVCG
ncbi:MAG: hypothetical protein HOV80_05800 [Polyangiaceae bacterium]|nr:hypothetical protein [Polyangiaceae bacterium]